MFDFEMFTWQRVLLGVGLFLVTFSISLGIVTLIMVKIPPDYFRKGHPKTILPNHPPAIRYLAIIGKNVVGVLLVALGIVMSLPGVPGQGFLTILLGVMLLDFPGKETLEQKLVSRPQVLKAINKIRRRFGKPALVLD
ncbi:MAG TPA: hypothetical protein VJU86_18460 [Pyrinomonadaceae bacterium]|nr:hypothetical protein [Pyrinomonadaceae bacterium]